MFSANPFLYPVFHAVTGLTASTTEGKEAVMFSFLTVGIPFALKDRTAVRYCK